ncbi:MAG: hypothetical protein K2L01_07310 [Rikenellaceae bacterium]|nr:hypothetical protein [Rikenellaceae bacterium]
MTDLTLRQIDKIRTLLASAIEEGGMRALDRDMVVAALRDLYDEVLSMPVATPSLSVAAEPEKALSADVTQEAADDAPSDAVEPECERPETKERDSRLAEVTLPWAETPPAPVDTPPAPVDSPSEPVSSREPVEEPEPAEEPRSAVQDEPSPEEPESPEVAGTALVEEEPDVLADEEEDAAEEAEEPAAEVTEGEPEAVEETVIIADTDDAGKEERHDPVEEITLSAEPILPEPTRLERMLADDRSLAARLGRERLVAVADELCHGDTETCLDMMEALEATGDFDMAVLYIQEHYPQKSDSRAIDMLVEVLSAKFI